MPPFALANNMWLGDTPIELSILTLPERLLIARYFPSAFIVKLYPKRRGAQVWDASTRYAGVRGNVSSYQLDNSTIAEMIQGSLMPKPSRLLSAVIGVAFVGFQQVKDKMLPSFLDVRRKRVRQALIWLKNHNPLYNDIQISDERLEMLPLQGVPEEIVANVRISDDLHVMSREHDGYVPEDDDLEVDILDDEQGVSTQSVQAGDQQQPCIIPIQSLGVVDVAGNEVPEQELFAHALHNLGCSQRPSERYIVRRGAVFVNEYARVDPVSGERFDGGASNPNHLMGCFPVLLPYGIGGFEVYRVADVPYEAHVRWALQYADKRFRKDMHFVFQVFGVIQKRKICSSASLQISRKTFNANQMILKTLKPSDFVRASEEEIRGVRFSNGAIQALRSQLRAVRVRVPGTDESRTSIRGKIWGFVVMNSPPNLWITINPSDLHDPVAQVMSGEEIDLENFCKTIGPTASERAMNICSDPYTASRYFHYIINLVIEELFGIKVAHDKRRFQRHTGILGRVQGYIGTVEAQNRGSLHLHMIVWLEGAPTSDEMKELLQTPSFREKLQQYISRVIKADIAGGDFTTVKAMKVEKEVSYSRPPDPRKPDFERRKEVMETMLARAVQFHTCDRERCLVMKGGRLLCKRRAPFSISSYDWVGPDGSWGPRRLCAYLNNWNSLLMICLGCNHDIKLLTNGAETKAISWYITTYVTKKQSGNSNVSALLAERLAYHRAQEKECADQNASLENKRLLQRCANTMNRMQQFSAPEAISYLMGWGDRFESHHFVTIYWDSAVKFLKRVFPELQVKRRKGDDSERIEFNGQRITLKDQLKEYIYRGEELRDTNFLDFVLNTYEGDELVDGKMVLENTGNPARGRPVSTRVPYKPGIKKPGKCRIICSSGHETMPCFVGPWFPRSDDADMQELYCASMLLLLMPWTSPTDLKNTNSSFSSTFEVFLRETSDKNRRVVRNIQYYHEAQRSAAVDRAREGLGLMSVPEIEHAAFGDDAEDENNGCVPVIPRLSECTITEEDIEHARRNREPQREVQYGMEAVRNGYKAGIFADVDIHASPAGIASTATFDELDVFRGWQKVLKEFFRDNATVPAIGLSSAAKTSLNPSQAEAIEQSTEKIRPSVISEVPMTISRVALPATETSLRAQINQDRLAILNTEQRRAHDIIEQQIIGHLLGRDPEQLLMLVVGQGGTGKSLLISAITETFTELGAVHMLAKIASSGIAASLIGGQTMHAWAGIPIRPMDEEEWVEKSSKKTLDTRRRNIQGRKVLLHDEMSMTTKDQLACLSQCASLVHVGQSGYHVSKPFGGMDVIMFGDFHQFPPVGNMSGALYCERRFTDKPRALYGRELYLQFTKVVILKEQMRVTDPRWHRMLQNLRDGECDRDDIQLLRGLILGDTHEAIIPDFALEPWSEAVLVTPRHVARQMWNSAALRKHSQLTGNRIYISRAEDTHGPTGKPLSGVQQYVLAGLKSEKTGKLPDTLPLSIGMKAMVVMNIATEADISNGTRGRIVDILLDPREVLPHNNSMEITLRFPPALILFKPDNGTPHRFEGVEPGLIPISPSETCFTIIVDSNKVQVRRRQIAVTAGYAFTDFKSQGQTIPALVVDLAKPPTGGALSPFSAYVALSRSRSRDTTRFIRDFDERLVTTHPSEDLRVEDHRLDGLDRLTREKWESACLQ